MGERIASLTQLEGAVALVIGRRTQLRAGALSGTAATLLAQGAPAPWQMADHGEPVTLPADVVAALGAMAVDLPIGLTVTVWAPPRHGKGRRIGPPMSLKLGPGVHAALRDAAAAEGVAVSTLARRLIAAGLGVSDG